MVPAPARGSGRRAGRVPRPLVRCTSLGRAAAGVVAEAAGDGPRRRRRRLPRPASRLAGWRTTQGPGGAIQGPGRRAAVGRVARPLRRCCSPAPWRERASAGGGRPASPCRDRAIRTTSGLISALAGALTRLTPVPREDACGTMMAARALRPEAAHDLAHLLDEMGRGDEAIATFRDLVERRGDNSWYLGCFGQCLKDHGRTEESSTVLARAMTLARAALELHPDNAWPTSTSPISCATRISWSEAEVEYRAALKIQPDTPRPTITSGIPEDQKSRPRPRSHSAAALKLEPDNAVFQSNLGNVLSNQGKPAEAEAAYRAALRLQPDNSKTLNNLGLVLAIQNKPAEAEAAYREAIQLKPDHMESHYNLANTLERQGKTSGGRGRISRGAEDQARPRRDPLQPRPTARPIAPVRRGPEGAPPRPRAGLAATRLELSLGGVDPRDQAGSRSGSPAAGRPQGRRRTRRRRGRARLRQAVLRPQAPRRGRPVLRRGAPDRPQTGRDRQAWHAYNAAWNAAMAGCGQGKDDPPPDEAARAGLRGQALAWLRGELAAWSRTLDGGKPEDRASCVNCWSTGRPIATSPAYATRPGWRSSPRRNAGPGKPCGRTSRPC